jgi:hypothetical protein
VKTSDDQDSDEDSKKAALKKRMKNQKIQKVEAKPSNDYYLLHKAYRRYD